MYDRVGLYRGKKSLCCVNNSKRHLTKRFMEYRAVLEALDQLQKRERYILLARILEERSFTELAQELQIGYKGAAAIYYRALSCIREKLEEET